MDITALDIKQQTFAKSIRGYDVAEVNAYLQVLSTKWEHMVGKTRDQEREINELREKLKHYVRVEEALHETLQTAKDSAEQRLATSKQEAQSRIEKAEMEAEKILAEARQARQKIKQNMLRLLERREEIINGMNSYLDTASRALDNFKADDGNVYSVPADIDDEGNTQAAASKELPRKAKLGNGNAKQQPVSAPDVDDILDQID